MHSAIHRFGVDKPQTTRYVKRMLQVLAAGLLLAAGSVFGAETAPDALVKSTADEVLAVIKQNKDKSALREIAEQKVVPHFDFKRMTQSAVGRAWRDATPAQQQALENGFRTLLVNTYTNALSTAATGSEAVDVKPVKVGADQNEVTVKTTIKDANKQVIPVDYRLEKSAAGWKVTDVVVENLSLVTNYRSNFASEVSRSGIDGLIKALEDKNRTVAKG
ncbi:MAG: signal peptide protein [Betaproteobacteria bacterium]|nr:signal peptide protein [Betaproteobacteria bacterium]